MKSYITVRFLHPFRYLSISNRYMKTRIIQTRFYEDSKISTLSYEAQNLFMYLLTCQYINISGIFELPDRKIIFEHKCTEKQLQKAKEELFDLGLCKFKDNWVFIINAEKNNKYRNSESNEVAYNKELERVPSDILDYFNSTVHSTVHSTYNKEIINNKQEIINNKENNFEKFWELYPKRVGRSVAEKSYNKMKDLASKEEAIIQGLQNYINYWKLKKTDKQYIPNPSTWLNQERWKDELTDLKKFENQTNEKYNF